MYTSSTSTTRGYVYTTNLAVGTLPCAENSYWLVSNFKILTLFHFTKLNLKPTFAQTQSDHIIVDAILVTNLVMMKMLWIIFRLKTQRILIQVGKR